MVSPAHAEPSASLPGNSLDVDEEPRAAIGSSAAGAPLRPRAMAAPGARASAPPESFVPAWLPWTIGGLGAACAVTTLVAWRIRQGHAERWDSEACVGTGRTRVQACSGAYYAVRDAEAVMWSTGVSSLLLIGGAAVLGHTRATFSVSTSAMSVGYSGTF